MSNNLKVLIVGGGIISEEYIKILKYLKIDFCVVCRKEKTRKKISNNYGCLSFPGGISKFFKNKNFDKKFSHAIIAVGIEDLYKVSKIVIENNIRKILVEKPGSILKNEFKNLLKISNQNKAEVFIGYNRRFYSNVIFLKKKVLSKEKVLSFTFDFTEWPRTFLKKFNQKVLSNWILSNSSHVIDLTFFIAGEDPKQIYCLSKKNIGWHSKSIFTGNGITKSNISFSYHSNWNSAGRWGISFFTEKGKYTLSPLEKLFFQKQYSHELKEIKIKNQYDIKFKPGYFLQTKEFLDNKLQKNLLSIKNQIDRLKLYNLIHNGKNY